MKLFLTFSTSFCYLCFWSPTHKSLATTLRTHRDGTADHVIQAPWHSKHTALSLSSNQRGTSNTCADCRHSQGAIFTRQGVQERVESMCTLSHRGHDGCSGSSFRCRLSCSCGPKATTFSGLLWLQQRRVGLMNHLTANAPAIDVDHHGVWCNRRTTHFVTSVHHAHESHFLFFRFSWIFLLITDFFYLLLKFFYLLLKFW